MGTAVTEADLQAKAEQITALDRENGQMLGDIAEVEKQLELARAKAAVCVSRANDQDVRHTYVICALLILISVILYLKT